MMPAGKMPPLPRQLLAGISGGADSMALLRLLLDEGIQVTAVHVNHGLRGEASDGDEAFVREVCMQRGVPLLAYRAEPPENPGEDWARRVRYAFFRQAAQEAGIPAIALAHHRDDQAETLLLHLLRGAGLTGLGGMAEDATVEGLRILRPLLAYSRQELRELLTAIGQDWREDASNEDPRYLRNALRRDVLPRLDALIPGAAARLANTAELLRDEAAALDEMTAAFLRDQGREKHMSLQALREEPLAIRRRILRAWWRQEAGGGEERSLSYAQTEALLALVGAQGRCNLPGGWTAQSGYTHLHLLDGQDAAPMAETPLMESQLIRLEAAEGRTGDGKRTQAMPRADLPDMTVRSRRPGDWIRPFGQQGRQSLQDYFVNRRVDAAFRDRVPLLCRGSEVLLAGGVGAGDVPPMKDQEESVLLCWTGPLPWHRNETGGR